MDPHKTRIMVLDDEPDIRLEINEFLTSRNFIVFEASAPSEAFRILKASPIDIAIIDIRLPEMNGLDVLKKIRAAHPLIQAVMMSGHGDMDAVIHALRLGAVDYFQKPFQLQDMLATIEKTRNYKFKSVQQDGDYFDYTLDHTVIKESSTSSLIIASAAMKSVVKKMKLVAQSKDTTVMITGESGTGKELIARGIHYMSPRKDKPFHAVNCSSIPDELFESEFFGYKKGAFTGANTDKPGWFEAADGGTLFLDEIGDLKLSLQAKLLRIMEDRQISRLGSTSTKKIDVRIVAATNQDLARLILEGRFRQDLYYRINTFVINLPPLRERPEGIPVLVSHYLDYYCHKMGREVPTLDDAVMAALMTYDFPGNVRELKHMIERSLILCEGDFLAFEHFDHLKLKHLDPVKEQNVSTRPGSLDEIEKASIEIALEHSNNNKSMAARILQISRQALDRKMEKLGISLK
jgi:DNA-binding NtrC family response regulator